MQERDIGIIEHIIGYCREIDATLSYFGTSEEAFRNNFIFRNAVSMCLLQIGELAGKLSREFIETHPEQPWAKMRGMRNIVAHAYGAIDIETVWNTATKNIPPLYSYCANLLSSL